MGTTVPYVTAMLVARSATPSANSTGYDLSDVFNLLTFQGKSRPVSVDFDLFVSVFNVHGAASLELMIRDVLEAEFYCAFQRFEVTSESSVLTISHAEPLKNVEFLGEGLYRVQLWHDSLPLLETMIIVDFEESHDA